MGHSSVTSGLEGGRSSTHIDLQTGLHPLTGSLKAHGMARE